MKHILILSAGVILLGLVPERVNSQTLREPAGTGTSAVAPLPGQAVQPIPKPDRSETIAPVNPEPQYLNQGQNPPPNVTRPLEPLANPSIDRLYQNRIGVDNYTPVTEPTQPFGPPPSTMQPEKAPNRPGTTGTSSQGQLDGR